MRYKKYPPHEFKVTPKDYLYALTSFPAFSKLLNPEGKPYQSLLLWINEFGDKYTNDDDLRLPSIGELVKLTGIKYAKIAKYLKDIYEDIHTHNSDFPNKFASSNQQLCYLIFNYLGNNTSFNLGLDVVPRVGESFEFYFIKPHCDGRLFYVTKIYHTITNGKQEVVISLKAKEPNLYLTLLREKALLHHDISFME